VLVASPDYLKLHGVPKKPKDLARHDALIYSTAQGDARWHFTGGEGSNEVVQVSGPLRSNNLSVLLLAARSGMGLAALPWYVAYQSVQSGAVDPILTSYTLPAQEIHAVYPSPRLVTAKVKGFVDWLSGQFGSAWWASGG